MTLGWERDDWERIKEEKWCNIWINNKIKIKDKLSKKNTSQNKLKNFQPKWPFMNWPLPST